MNLYYPWSTSGSPYDYDVQNSATHEFGHAVGLGDITTFTEVQQQHQGQWNLVTMYKWSTYGDTFKRTLHQDDIDGFLARY